MFQNDRHEPNSATVPQQPGYRPIAEGVSEQYGAEPYQPEREAAPFPTAAPSYEPVPARAAYPPTPESYAHEQDQPWQDQLPDQSWQAQSPAQPMQATTPPTSWHPQDYATADRLPPRKPAAGRGVRTGAIFLLTLLLALVFGVGLFAGWQFGHSSAGTTVLPALQTGNTHAPVPQVSGNNTAESVRELVISQTKPAVVQLNVTTSQGGQSGSGVIIDKRGYIVTNNHVVLGSQSIEIVLADGTKVENAKLVGTDPNDDLAVVKINPPANMAVANLGDSAQLRVGQDVMAIGNPLGITQTVTNGIVSALNRNVRESNAVTIPGAIQTDAPINPGNSGGALIDMQGDVIGIPTLTAIDPEFNAPANGVGFAIPSNRVKFIVTQIIADGKVTHTGRPVLGISARDVDASIQSMDNLAVDHGILIASLTANGPAQQAGIQPGDVIVTIDNNKVDNMSVLTDVLATKSPGDKVAVTVYRGTRQVTVNVTLGELQAGN